MCRVGGVGGWAVDFFDGGSDLTSLLEVGAILQLSWGKNNTHLLEPEGTGVQCKSISKPHKRIKRTSPSRNLQWATTGSINHNKDLPLKLRFRQFMYGF